MRVWLSIAIAVCLGCGNKKAPPPAGDDTSGPGSTGKHGTHEPSGKPHPQGKLEVKVDGKVVPMATALAWRTPDGRYKLTASSVPVGCDDVTGDMRTLFDGEVTFDVTAANLLQPDGTRKPAIVSTYYSGSTRQEVVPTKGKVTGTPDEVTTIDVAFEAKSAMKEATALSVKGTMEAIGCETPSLVVPKSLPAEMGATMTIAGVQMPIKNAIINQGPGESTSLFLTTGLETCTHAAGERGGEFNVTLTWFKKDSKDIDQITLGGSWLPSAIDQTFDKLGIGVEPGIPAKIGQFKLHADIKVNGYPLQLVGSVVTDLCKPKR